jgi:hypothetical protein
VDAFLHLQDDARLRICEQTAARLGLNPVAIEKDFWACWTLRELCGLAEWGGHFTLKGGTSLSKAWHQIERFSEDLDLVIGRTFLGFGGEAGPEHAPTTKQQQKRLKQLKATCQERIRTSLMPALRTRFAAVLPAPLPWKVEEDGADPDHQTLLFHYPAVVATGRYVQPVVRLEFGARSDTEPCETPQIQAYVCQEFPDVLGAGTFAVRTVAARRTFWEKALLLHEETFRPQDKPRKERLARHYYDVFRLIVNGVADDALADAGLFERVLAHRVIFFGWSWVDYNAISPTTLRLVPPDEHLAAWRQDYRAMQGEMFFGEPPTFDEVLRMVSQFEARCRQTRSQGV